jgi:hypothetical protein
MGRGACYDPWLFTRTAHYLKTGAVPDEPDFEERVALMCGHLDRMIAFHGEELGCRLFRKMAPWYARRFGPAVYFRRRMSAFGNRAEFDQLLGDYRRWRSRFLDENGQLLDRYKPVAPYSSFMDTTDEPDHEGIAVPKGPTAIW